MSRLNSTEYWDARSYPLFFETEIERLWGEVTERYKGRPVDETFISEYAVYVTLRWESILQQWEYVKPFDLEEYLIDKGIAPPKGKAPFVGEEVTKTEDMNLELKPELNDSKVSEVPAVTPALVRVPNWSRNGTHYNYSKKANRYLKYQESRIIASKLEGNIKKAVLIWLILLRQSFSYQVALLNKVYPHWHHWLDIWSAKELLRQICNNCRKVNYKLVIRRYYILKKDGVRWRPIGAPDIASRVISRALNDMIYFIWEGEFGENQHGFRKHRSPSTAVLSIIKKLKRNPKIVYEFDLRSFFNTVKISAVYDALFKKNALLADVILKYLVLVEYRLPRLREDVSMQMELKKSIIIILIVLLIGNLLAIMLWDVLGLIISIITVGTYLEIGYSTKWAKWRKDVSYKWAKWMMYTRDPETGRIIESKEGKLGLKEEKELEQLGYSSIILLRSGLPQGLGISPVLSTLALELYTNHKDIDLFADDGTFIGNDWEEFETWRRDVSIMGAEIAKEKSGLVEEKFTFMGLEINLKKRIVVYKGKKISWYDELLEEKLKKIYQEGYNEYNKSWTWFIKSDSYTAMHYRDFIDLKDIPLWDLLQIIWKSIWLGLPHKGMRWFPGRGIIDIISGSSDGCNWLLSIRKELNLGAIKPLCPTLETKWSYLKGMMLKGNKRLKYQEMINDERLPNIIESKVGKYQDVI